MIIDFHAHVSDTDYGNMDLLRTQMVEAGIDKCVIVPGGMMDVRVMTLYIMGEKESNPEIPNPVVLSAMKKYPGIMYGFLCINPLKKEETNSWIEYGKANHFVGIKLNPMSHKFSFSGKTLTDAIRECAHMHWPVYSHTLFDVGASTKKFCELARKHPDVNFVIGHMGFGPSDITAFNLAKEIENVYLESSNACFLAISEALKIAGPDKILFGSEFPMSLPEIQLFQMKKMGLSERDADKVFRVNAIKLVPSLES